MLKVSPLIVELRVVLDAKEVKKLAGEIHKISSKVHPQIQLMESIYRDVGLKLEKYFDIEN